MEESSYYIPDYLTTEGAQTIPMPMTPRFYDVIPPENFIEPEIYPSTPIIKESEISEKEKGKSPYRTIPFILYICLSVVVLFGFLYSKRSPTETLVYFLMQSIFIVAMGSVVFWLANNDSLAWAWVLAALSLTIQILWVAVVIYY